MPNTYLFLSISDISGESEEYLRNAHMNSCSEALREHQTGSPSIEIARYIVDFRWFWIRSAAVKGRMFISNKSQ